MVVCSAFLQNDVGFVPSNIKPVEATVIVVWRYIIKPELNTRPLFGLHEKSEKNCEGMINPRTDVTGN